MGPRAVGSGHPGSARTRLRRAGARQAWRTQGPDKCPRFAAFVDRLVQPHLDNVIRERLLPVRVTAEVIIPVDRPLYGIRIACSYAVTQRGPPDTPSLVIGLQLRVV